MLSVQDARRIAVRVPNARAFAETQHASLKTTLNGAGRIGSIRVRVVANAPGKDSVEVGVYTVDLRTGSVLDDDQEPADDEVTRKEELRLLTKLCHL